MSQIIAKIQPTARAWLSVTLGFGIWIGVAAMAFGLASWFGAFLTSSAYAHWVARLIG
jgi:hypothetical protein